MLFNVRGLGKSKVTTLGNNKLDYIYEVSPKKNCVICLTEVSFNWNSLPTLGLSVPALKLRWKRDWNYDSNDARHCLK